MTRRDPAAQAFSLLYFAYIVAPIVAGGNVIKLMDAVGIVEMVAGIIVAARLRIGGIIVAVWLWAIIVNLLLIPGYFDICLRDFGLSLGALAMSRLSVVERA